MAQTRGAQATVHGPNTARHPVIIGPYKILRMYIVVYLYLYIVNFCNVKEKSDNDIYVICSRANHSITATIEGNGIDLICLG